MKKVLVTGCNGYIGSHVVKTLADMGCYVIGVDIKKGNYDSRVEFKDCDIFSKDSNLFESLGSPDCLIHLAWKDGFVHNSDSHLNSLPNHLYFLKYMIDSGCKNISVMGSMHEIGFYEGQVDENTPTNPISFYGISKNALRQSLNVINKNSDFYFKWLRGYYITGDDIKNNSIFAKLIQKEQEGAEKFPFVSGKNKYDFIDIKRLALQIALAGVQDEVCGIINCCSGKPITLKEKVEEFIKQNNMKIKLEYGVYPERPYDSSIIFGSTTKITQILNNSLGKYSKSMNNIISKELEELNNG